MNKKFSYLSLFLVLAVFLSSCTPMSMGTPPSEEEQKQEQIKNVVLGFWSALEQEDWYEAASYIYRYDNMFGDFLYPYMNERAILHDMCPDLIISIYVYVSDISFVDPYEPPYEAKVTFQVNNTIMCGGVLETIVQFGTMTVEQYSYYYHDDWYYLDDWAIHNIDLKHKS